MKPRFEKMSEAEYHSDPYGTEELPSLSQSTAHTLLTYSPEHAYLRHPKLGGSSYAPTKAMDKGALVHALLFQGGEGIQVVEADNWATKAAKEARETIRGEGKTPVLMKDLIEARDCVEAVRRRLKVLQISLHGESELSAFWEEVADDGTVVPCKARFDHLILDSAQIWDAKTCTNANPEGLPAKMIRYGYHIQRACYSSALEKIHPELVGRSKFGFLFFETEPPYSVVPARADGAMRTLGESQWRRAVNLWAKCLNEKKWPGYTDQMIGVDAPIWALNNEMEQDNDNAII